MTDLEYKILCFYDPEIPKELDYFTLAEYLEEDIDITLNLSPSEINENPNVIIIESLCKKNYIGYHPSEYKVFNSNGVTFAITGANHKKYIITQTGIDKKNKYEIEIDKKMTLEKNAIDKSVIDLLIAKWTYKMRWLPFFISGAALVVSVFAYFKPTSKEPESKQINTPMITVLPKNDTSNNGVPLLKKDDIKKP